jgi:hypothetical protein
MAASLAVANLGPDAGRRPSTPVADSAPEQPAGTDDRARAARQVLVRPVAAAGAAVFVVRASRRPARVRLEVAGPAGSNVVRHVVVRSRDGRRLVVSGLDGGTYEWSATSPTAAPVTGEVRVPDQESPVATAADVPSQNPTPTTPAPSPTAIPTSTPTSTPTPAATPTSTPAPTVPPTQHPSPTPQPSPTRQPSPSSEPTDPGTQDPGLVG